MCEHASVIRLKTPKVAEHDRERPISACVWASSSVIVPNICLESENCEKKVFTASFHTFDARQTSLILFLPLAFDLLYWRFSKATIFVWNRDFFVRSSLEMRSRRKQLTLLVYYCMTSWHGCCTFRIRTYLLGFLCVLVNEKILYFSVSWRGAYFRHWKWRWSQKRIATK